MRSIKSSWHGTCDLRFFKSPNSSVFNNQTIHQGSCQSPFKLMRAFHSSDGRCELPILHTAGGLVGGDQLSIRVKAEKGSSCLLTSVAAQKVYGSIGRSKIYPKGQWSNQECHFVVEEGADFEWMPQEVILFENGLFEQKVHVNLSPLSTFLSVDVVRLGRTTKGETLGSGCWRSSLEICRLLPDGKLWEFIDRLEIKGETLSSEYGMKNQPVLGSFVWISPVSLPKDVVEKLLAICREETEGLNGSMSCSSIHQGISARYLGPSTQSARFWFFRIWTQIRALRCLPKPDLPRVWPIQENPYI